MCGFVGVIGRWDEPRLQAMTDMLAHRGPDDSAMWIDPSRQMFLGFRRLSIVDHAGGAQPMLDNTKTVALVFNGEIYNHRELRRDLEARGAVFRSNHSDTEVILQGYLHFGMDVVSKLNGMFAFAILDRRRRRLFLARDRFGEKPLFFGRMEGGQFSFASEITPLSTFSPSFSRPMIAKFLAYGNLPAPHTFYTNLRKVRPGSTVSVDLDSLQWSEQTYWDCRVKKGGAPAGGARQWAKDIREILYDSVERRMEADVSLGYLLSGGVDSAAVVTAARSFSGGSAPLMTFTAGFEEASFDERGPAREVARALGTRHFETVVTRGDTLDRLTSILRGMDEPIADPSLLPTHLLCAFAQQHVTVALSGDGGDELFAGYDPFKALFLARWYGRLTPRCLHRVMVGLAERLPIGSGNMAFDFKLKRTLRGLSEPAGLWNPVWLAPASAHEIEMLTGERVKNEDLLGEAFELWESCESTDMTDRTIEFFANFYLQQILTKVDRASMLCSLEVRSPFLDPDLADYALSLPASAKFRHGQGKVVLRRALTGHLDNRILRRKKKGFGIPLVEWLRRLPLPDLSRAEDLGIDPSAFAKMWQAHRDGVADHRGALWAVLTLLESGLRGSEERSPVT